LKDITKVRMKTLENKLIKFAGKSIITVKYFAAQFFFNLRIYEFQLEIKVHFFMFPSMTF